MGSSYGISRIATTWDPNTQASVERARTADFPDELLRQQYRFSSDVLIETWVERDRDVGEISVDGMVIDAVPRIAAITEKHVAADDGREFAEVGQSSNLAVSSVLRAALDRAIKALVSGLALRTTAFHAEFLLVGGQPVFVEVGARLGGDLIPRLVEIATGIDLVRGSVLAALNLDVADALEHRRNRGASIIFFNRILAPAPAGVDIVEEAAGHLIVTADDQATCAATVRAILRG
jgi:biotin carboxylase